MESLIHVYFPFLPNINIAALSIALIIASYIAVVNKVHPLIKLPKISKMNSESNHKSDQLQLFSVLSQIPFEIQKDITSRLIVDNITARDIQVVFDGYAILQHLQFPCGLNELENDLNAQEQSFRDLIRERIEINNKPIDIDPNIPFSQFKQQFQQVVENAISPYITLEHAPQLSKIAVMMCCHLSRTRSGGVSQFALLDLPSSLLRGV